MEGKVNDNTTATDSSSTLARQCIEILAEHFCDSPVNVEELPPNLIDELMLHLGPNLDPYILARHIVSERYWKHRLADQQSHGSLLDHTCSKGEALEYALQQSLEKGDFDDVSLPCGADIYLLTVLLCPLRTYIFYP